eukprot:Hpha_TRINITY_DN10730_c0_g1::TRINITY_DN10730_c0_g1_i1::g.43553::m.43553
MAMLSMMAKPPAPADVKVPYGLPRRLALQDRYLEILSRGQRVGFGEICTGFYGESARNHIRVHVHCKRHILCKADGPFREEQHPAELERQRELLAEELFLMVQVAGYPRLAQDPPSAPE